MFAVEPGSMRFVGHGAIVADVDGRVAVRGERSEAAACARSVCSSG